jgi:hypothetical protein
MNFKVQVDQWQLAFRNCAISGQLSLYCKEMSPINVKIRKMETAKFPDTSSNF